MKQLYCKNCGAPIEHRYTHRCRYCDTVIFSDDIEDELEEDEEIDIELDEYNCDKFNSISRECYDAIKDSLGEAEEMLGSKMTIVEMLIKVIQVVIPTIIMGIIFGNLQTIIDLFTK